MLRLSAVTVMDAHIGTLVDGYYFFWQGNPRDLGEKQSWVLKLFLGALLITALVLLIWGPLLVISLISSTNQPNPPVEIDIKLSLGGFQVHPANTQL